MKLMTSFATMVPLRMHVVAEPPVWCTVSLVVVKSFPSHTHPFGAVGNVMVMVDAPLVPVHVILPTAVPPVVVVMVAHVPVPVAVNLVPESIT